MDLDDLEEGDEISMVIEMDDDYVDYSKIESPSHDDAAQVIDAQQEFPQYWISEMDLDMDSRTPGVGIYCIFGPNGPACVTTENDPVGVEPVTMWGMLRRAAAFQKTFERLPEEETPYPEILEEEPHLAPDNL